MPGFSSFRIVPFEPQFHWENSMGECADRINRPHEDYPRYVAHTGQLLSCHHDRLWPGGSPWPDILNLQGIHQSIFRGEKSSLFREHDVIVGLHKPPPWREVPRLMGELCEIYAELEPTPARIEEWYVDFETIHPYGDGNGRVGGVVVALMMYHHHPDKRHRLWTPGAGPWVEKEDRSGV